MSGFKIVKKPKTDTAPKKRITIRRQEPETERPRQRLIEAYFDGEVDDRPIQFPDDVEHLIRELRHMGYDVPPADVQALGNAVSLDYYPWPRVKPERAWLKLGRLLTLVREHAKDYLRGV